MDNVILVGVDGSPESVRALDWAIVEAEVREWPVRLVCAFSPASVVDPVVNSTYAASAELEAGVVLTDAMKRVADRSVRAEAHIASTDADRALIEHSKSVRIAVVGKRGRGGFAGRLGSVSSGLAAHSACPTVVVPEGWQTGDARADTTAEPSFDGQIVMAYESDSPDSALWEAAEMARVHAKPLAVVAVRSSLLGDAGWKSAEAQSSRYHQEVSTQLDRVVEAVRERFPDIDVNPHVLVGGATEILVQATRTADLLVLGTRGHGGVAGLLLDSISQAVLHHGQSPMMVVPRP